MDLLDTLTNQKTYSNSPSKSNYDAVVIGSGPNGLAAAITLAQEGHSVLVVEGKDTPGGGMRTQELTLPGFQHDVCSAIHPMALASPFFQSLQLEQQGLEWIQPELPVVQPIDKNRIVLQHRGIDETAEGLGEHDAEAYRKIFEPLVANADKLYADLLGPLGVPGHPFAMAGFGMRALGSARGLAEGNFRSDEARALIAGHAAHSILPLEHAGTAAFGLMLAMTGHAMGWPIPKGGSISIGNALLAVFDSLGGEMVCGTMVESIEDLPKAGAYLFDTGPRAMAEIAHERLGIKFREKLDAYRYGPGVFKVDWALSEPIPWIHEEAKRTACVHLGGTFDQVADSESKAWDGVDCSKPFLIVAQPSLFDGTRAPDGKHTGWAYCHVPHGSKIDMLHPLELQIERFAPGFRDTILERHVLNTEGMEAYNPNYVGGDVIGGVQDLRQLYARPVNPLSPYTTSERDIFICSASTPPGAGVHGMCGYHAARKASRRLR